MSLFEPSLPKRRKFVHQAKEPPFPVPIESQQGLPARTNRWQHYTARIFKGGIFVDDKWDVQCLYAMGFFGKGTLSRHKPNYSSRQPLTKQTDQRSSSHSALQVMTRRKYFYHTTWAGLYTTEQEDQIPVPTVTRVSADVNGSKLCVPHPGEVSGDSMTCDYQKHLGSISVSKDSLDMVMQQAPKDACDTEHTQSEDDPWAKTTQAEAEDFWGVISSSEGTKPHVEKTIFEQHSSSAVSNKVNEPELALAIVSAQDTIQSVETSLKDQTCTLDDQNELGVRFCEAIKPSEDSPSTSEATKPCTSDTTIDDLMTSKLDGEGMSEIKATSIEGPAVCHSGEKEEGHTSSLDHRCMEPDPDGDMLVVNDTDDSDIDEKQDPRPKWKPVIKKQPFLLEESLELSMEEAFFLSYALGCLVVYDDNDEILDLEAMWLRFCSQDSQFICRYTVYHNLRSKGWVPKSGLKYGTDFIVYKDGPAFYHSTLSVIIVPISENKLDVTEYVLNRLKTWTQLAALNRVTEQVSKDLMLCYVLQPSVDASSDFWLTPSCLSSHKIQEVVMRRWISKHERENAEYVLIP